LRPGMDIGDVHVLLGNTTSVTMNEQRHGCELYEAEPIWPESRRLLVVTYDTGRPRYVSKVVSWDYKVRSGVRPSWLDALAKWLGW
jgi:hypothetical protein